LRVELHAVGDNGTALKRRRLVCLPTRRADGPPPPAPPPAAPLTELKRKFGHDADGGPWWVVCGGGGGRQRCVEHHQAGEPTHSFSLRNAVNVAAQPSAPRRAQGQRGRGVVRGALGWCYTHGLLALGKARWRGREGGLLVYRAWRQCTAHFTLLARRGGWVALRVIRETGMLGRRGYSWIGLCAARWEVGVVADSWSCVRLCCAL
jgi:hypothetical protein